MKDNLPPVFMPRNEEEIMRTLIALDQQLKYVDDRQQVSIAFDEQTERNLYFTVIVVRIVKEMTSIGSKVRQSSFLHYFHDRSRHMGLLRKKHPKEATVFRVKFVKDPFLRGDGAIDIYRAREALAVELARLIGDFRDYNGGTLKKQKQLLEVIQARMTHDLLESFFYSIVPVIMRSILEPEVLITLFNLLFEEKRMHFDGRFTYVIMKSQEKKTLEEKAFYLFEQYPGGIDLVQGYVKIGNCHCMGYIYRGQDHEKFQSQSI